MMNLSKIKPFLFLGVFYMFLSLIIRLIFVFHPITTETFGLFEVLKILFIGAVNDGLVFVLASSILAVYFLFLSDSKYVKPYGYLIFGGFIIAMLYTAFVPGNIFKQYGGVIPEIALSFIGLKTILFGLMLFLPTKRKAIRDILYFIILFFYTLFIILNGVSEYFFWNEFGVRYNFIAVDYLIYTNEVIGNIMESYPIIPLFSIIITVTALITFLIYKKTKDTLVRLPNFYAKLTLLGTFLILCLLAIISLPKLNTIKSQNVFSTEIQANGLEKFYYAFTHNELDYFKFYPTVAENKAEKNILKQLNATSLLRNISSNEPELKKNVVLISIESLSAEFLSTYGNTQKITPFLDSLAQKSLLFTNLYATGNRTVRGLEALTLCLPPTAGESVIKRDNNKNKFSTGSVFKSKGYQVKYLYGGYSYFDNMKDFFEGNGYDIVDRDQFQPEEISFANVWGVCDEDMAKKAIKVMNEEAKTNQPFFNHWMTVSNHRPFTYPEGKIDIPGTAKARDGGVKYTDYALKQFFEMAKKQTWYKNTVFVIISDHCASSAGSTELPMDKYRIPAMVFSEGYIEPQHFNTLMSQIDVMPTVFSLLHFNYQSKFIGQNVFNENYQPRAYVATYQDLGLIKNNYLTIISPTKKIKQYALSLEKPKDPSKINIFYKETLLKQNIPYLAEDCVSAYQSTSKWLKENKLNK